MRPLTSSSQPQTAGDLDMDALEIGRHFATLAAAFALAVPIGWDREKSARSAGLRTFPLVAWPAADSFKPAKPCLQGLLMACRKSSKA